jgi:hypothetical protein
MFFIKVKTGSLVDAYHNLSYSGGKDKENIEASSGKKLVRPPLQQTSWV